MAIYKTYDENLNEEASAFDSQILQRVNGGHIPDLRNMSDCDYFYNNPWRRKFFANLDFGDQAHLITSSINKHFDTVTSGVRVLEVGSGPGYMSLELAREGFNVTGVELSQDCVVIARETAQKYSPELLGNTLKYVCDDFFAFAESNQNKFDVVLFVGALHHFPDQLKVHKACRELLSERGVLICHEPVRDKVTKRNAIANVLVTTLLQALGGYFTEAADICSDEIKEAIEKRYLSLRYELEDGDKAQSINDNEAGFAEMFPLLSAHYKELQFEWRYGMFHEIIGGLRVDDVEIENKVATFIRDIDKLMCEEGLIDATEFFFVGRAEGAD